MPKVIDHERIRQEAQTLRKDGLTLQQIAKQLKISYVTLTNIFNDKIRFKKAKRLKEQIFLYNIKGLTNSEISRLTNCSRQYVSQILLGQQDGLDPNASLDGFGAGERGSSLGTSSSSLRTAVGSGRVTITAGRRASKTHGKAKPGSVSR